MYNNKKLDDTQSGKREAVCSSHCGDGTYIL